MSVKERFEHIDTVLGQVSEQLKAETDASMAEVLAMKESLAIADKALERLEVAVAQNSLGSYTQKNLDEQFEAISNLTVLVEFEDDSRDFELPFIDALKALNKRIVYHLNHSDLAKEAMTDYDSGRETEFDPFKMEQEVDDEQASLETYASSLRQAYFKLKGK